MEFVYMYVSVYYKISLADNVLNIYKLAIDAKLESVIFNF